MNECDSWMVNRAHGKVLKYMIVALLLVKSSYISSPWFGSYTLNLPRYFKEITRMQDIESRPASSVGPLQSMVPGASHELLEQFPPYIYIYTYICNACTARLKYRALGRAGSFLYMFFLAGSLPNFTNGAIH